ncbi:MAG: helix-turn-helix domain-containing protein [Candidatus Omnitrophica bacterium]|nr:helix-turn-helix domain-containing protein [Candidatus Omnitrophota bacterium]
MTEDRRIVAEILSYLEKNDMKQYQLAQRLSVPPSTVTRWIKTGKIGNQSIQLLKREGIIK